MEASRGPPRVKNKAAAPIQISAEQLLREAVDRQDEKLKAPTQRFADMEELHEFQGRKRKEFEDYVRRNRINMNNWMRYAAWELEQKEFRRARSIFERALDVDSTSVALWLRYIDSEMKHRNIQHARNLLDRAVTILPRVDKIWYKYWIKWAKFEEEHGTSDLVRDVYGTAVTTLGDEFMDEKLFMAYAKFEARLKELERARAIYKFALDRMPRSKSVNLHKAFTTFEKQYGDRDGIEDVVLSKRRVHYEEQIKENSKNYDAWIDFARLEETSGNQDRVRDIYERAIAQIPPTQEKRHWRRYIYLWLFYAVYEETVSQDIERTRQIYQECIRLLPHKRFTFAKVWLMFAHFEVRQGQLTTARKLLGQSLGMCPKDKLFKVYIELEMKLFEFNRCRQLYTKYIEWNGSNCQTWIKFAELERGLDDLDRARAIFELAVEEQQLDMPELLWKATLTLKKARVWTSWAQFELGSSRRVSARRRRNHQRRCQGSCREIFKRAHTRLKERDLKEDRVALLSAWKSFEDVHGSPEDKEKIEKQMPRKVKKRRKLDDDSFEEYVDYVFPADDESAANLAKLLANAQKWKMAKAAQAASKESEESTNGNGE
ncbi:hypothetical protein J3E74DRAFT_423813 [Bipolaris maydis]|nr:hypothetical protein J3E74DRAFT_423813 [Bipolaris maydis]